MKNIFAYFITLFVINLGAFAHEDFNLIGNVGNVVFTAEQGNESFYRNEIIASLCRDYIIQNFPDKSKFPVYLIMGDNPDMKFSLESENLQGDSWNKRIQSKDHREIGIRIHGTFTEGFGAKILKLLEYGLYNWSELETKREKVLQSNYPPKSSSISEEKILQILNGKTNNKIEKVISQQIPRGLNKPMLRDKLGSIYYYQTDKFHFYKQGDINLNSIYQILKINDNKWMIFDTASSFHFWDFRNPSLNKYFKLPELEGDNYIFNIKNTFLRNDKVIVTYLNRNMKKRKIEIYIKEGKQVHI